MTTGPLVIFDLLKMTEYAAALVILPGNSYECGPTARRLETANSRSDRLKENPMFLLCSLFAGWSFCRGAWRKQKKVPDRRIHRPTAPLFIDDDKFLGRGLTED
jgi:hypothetical protein